MTYILADDEEMYRDYTLSLLEKITTLECLAVCDNAVTAREKIISLQPDFIILDIKMPDITGIQLAKSLKKLPLVIFITSHTNYAVDAFEIDAVDYLVKPITPERLYRAIDKVTTLLELKKTNTPEDSISISDDTAFFIKDKSKYLKIQNTEVLYFESMGDFVTLNLENGEKKIVLVNLKSLESQVNNTCFIRISRTHMVNKQKITGISPTLIYLPRNIQLSIGQTYADAILKNILGNKTIKRFS